MIATLARWQSSRYASSVAPLKMPFIRPGKPLDAIGPDEAPVHHRRALRRLRREIAARTAYPSPNPRTAASASAINSSSRTPFRMASLPRETSKRYAIPRLQRQLGLRRAASNPQKRNPGGGPTTGASHTRHERPVGGNIVGVPTSDSQREARQSVPLVQRKGPDGLRASGPSLGMQLSRRGLVRHDP